MFEILKTKIVSAFVTTAIFLGSLLGINAEAPQTQMVGATIPTSVALFETSLANSITDTATAMTLVSATTKNGTTLATSTYGFIIDEGTSVEEFVLATCVSTSCTSMTRGIDVITGNTSATALKKAHRRGASVKITDAPQLLILSRIVNGDESLPNVLKYDGIATTTIAANDNNLATVGYANSLAFGSIPQASETAGGFVELATGQEAASSTLSGSAARLVLPTSVSTSTAPTSGHVIPVTGTDGNLAEGFLSTTLAQNYTFSGTTTFSGVTVFTSTTTIQRNYAYADSPVTWTKPSGIKYIDVELWAGGGGGYVSGGGGGAYHKARFFASQLGSTETITIGAGGIGGASRNDGGNTTFGALLTAYGGGKGSNNQGGGGGGGTGSKGNGSNNSTGAQGGEYQGGTAGQSSYAGGGGGGTGYNAGDIADSGGSSYFGGGGGGGAETGTTSQGGAGGSSIYAGGGGGGSGTTAYGAGGTSQFGGAGGSNSVGAVPSGGGSGSNAGGNGQARVTEYYY